LKQIDGLWPIARTPTPIHQENGQRYLRRNQLLRRRQTQPMQALIDKCAANIRNGYRAVLLVSESKIQAAKQLAEIAGYQQRIGISSLEQFVGQNIEEIGEFGKAALAKNVKALLEKYNERILAVETDRSLLIEIPNNL